MRRGPRPTRPTRGSRADGSRFAPSPARRAVHDQGVDLRGGTCRTPPAAWRAAAARGGDGTHGAAAARRGGDPARRSRTPPSSRCGSSRRTGSTGAPDNPYDPDADRGRILRRRGRGRRARARRPSASASDIGGSIRVPAFFSGVFGHKSSRGWCRTSGMAPVAKGESTRMLAVGPITRRAEDLMPVLRTIAGPTARDPLAGRWSSAIPGRSDSTGCG